MCAAPRPRATAAARPTSCSSSTSASACSRGSRRWSTSASRPGGWSQVVAPPLARRADRGHRPAADRSDRGRHHPADGLHGRRARRTCCAKRSAARPTWCCRTWRRTPSATRRPTICGPWGWSRRRLQFAVETLRPGGAFVAKVLAGGADSSLVAELKRHFTTVKHAKPPASRKESSEWYVVAQGFKGRSDRLASGRPLLAQGSSRRRPPTRTRAASNRHDGQ